MALFHYPKGLHRRSLSPPSFRSYKTYKRYLQAEFRRVCVYCRQPDSGMPNLNFGVDHYRPKADPRFAGLVCDYANLYYCCGACNSRKRDYWPTDEEGGPYVVAPCEHDMAKHLRFNGSTGVIEPTGVHGIHTEQLLQLNDPASVAHRRGQLKLVQLCDADIAALKKQIKELELKFRRGEMSRAQVDAEVLGIEGDLSVVHGVRQGITGELPLAPLPKQRFGVRLHP